MTLANGNDMAITMGMEGDGVAAPGGRPQATAELRLLEQCRQHAETQLHACTKQVFDKADDLLFERSNGSTPDAADYFNALRVLRLERPQIESNCSAHFSRLYHSRIKRNSGASAEPAPLLATVGLSLVDEKELEESLAIEGLVAKGKERFRVQLHALTQRYSVITPGVDIDENTHPLAPDVICDAFREALDGVDIGVAVKLIIYKLFEQHVLRTLAMLYDDVNTLLLDAGILPQLKAAVVRSGDAARPVGDGAASSSAQSAAAALSSAQQVPAGEGQTDVYQTLQLLMSRKKYGGTPAPQSAWGSAPDDGGPAAGAMHGDGFGAGYGYVAGPPLPADALVQGLSLLQQLPPPADAAVGESGIAYIKAGLMQQLGDAAAGKSIDPVHDNTIDVIGMIFEFILDEPSIPELVKRLLNQLQIPILKVAIVDKEFFTHKHHPARRLLNTLGHASFGWNEKDATTQQRRFKKMEEVVAHVLADYQTDPGVFAELLSQFTAFLTAEDDDYAAETVSEELGHPTAATPAQKSFEAVALLLDGTEPPAAVRDFLHIVWQRVLTDAAARGVNELWQRRWQTADDLLWSVAPKKTSEERRRMVALLPRLLAALQDGMTAVACPPAEIDAVLGGLEPIHMACLRGEAPGLVTTASHAPASQAVKEMIQAIHQDVGSAAGDAGQDDASQFDFEQLPQESSYFDQLGGLAWDEDQQHVDDEFTALVRNLAVGGWVEFVSGDKKRRVKLGWKSAVLGQFVFVDRRYRVVAEKNLHDLAADFRTGRAVVVARVGMFDRALDKVLSGLLAGAGH